MSNDEPLENAAKEAQSMQGSSEEQPLDARDDATRPKPALEPTEQDESEKTEHREAFRVTESAGHDGAVELARDETQVAPGQGLAEHHSGADHGLAHTMPVWMLIAVLGALMGLTVLTVSVTNFDLGSQGNLIVAMVIATIKAGLVVTFFMHVLWDKKFHLILFLTAILFVVLFLSMSTTDRSEYQHNIDLYQSITSATPSK